MTFDSSEKVEQETTRTYIFPDMEVEIPGVTFMQWNVAEPDRHYLTTAEGYRLISPGWRALFIASPPQSQQGLKSA
jgi:hypothetical protein